MPEPDEAVGLMSLPDVLSEANQIKEEYTTTELYEKIYSSLINIIMKFVCQNKEDEVEKIDELSKTFIDNLLSQNLEIKENKWIMKEGVKIDKCN